MSVNVPVTVWRDTAGLVEYGSDGPDYIVDTTGFYIVDPSASYIVDTGVTAQLIPATIWMEDDSL